MSYKFRDGNTEAYILKHALILGGGFLLMIYIHKFKINYFSRLSQIGIIISVILLMLVLVMPNGGKAASRWLFGFQPSDMAKISLIVYLARQLSVNKEQLKVFKVLVIKIMLPIALICGLILPADLSTALMLFAVSMVLVFVSNVSIKHIGAIFGLAIIGFSLLLLLGTVFPKMLPRVPTWTSRISSFVKGDETENAADKN
ncbi:MAG: cell division protein FtsW, partial [Flavobacteriales bacterium]